MLAQCGGFNLVDRRQQLLLALEHPLQLRLGSQRSTAPHRDLVGERIDRGLLFEMAHGDAPGLFGMRHARRRLHFHRAFSVNVADAR